MTRYICQIPAQYILPMAIGCWTIFCTPVAQAANEEVIVAARACAQQNWTSKGGHERALAYREAVNCFKDLYIRVAGGARSNEAFKKELTTRLDKLEAAYHASRDTCSVQEKLGLEDQGCGTIRLSSHEFIHILKTMILDADTGWVRSDPTLAEALKLNQ